MANTHAAQGASVDDEIREQLLASEKKDIEAPLLEKVSESLEEATFISKYNDPKSGDLSGFDKLKKYHSISPPLAAYDASQPLKYLIKFSGTALEMTFRCMDFWILLSVHVIVSLVYHHLMDLETKDGFPAAPGWPQISVGMLAIPGSLTVFVLVFYLNQSFSQYLLQSAKISSAIGSLGEFLVLLRVHMTNDSFPKAREARHQLWKFTNALLNLALTMHPSYRGEKIDIWGWWFLQEYELLTPGQIAELKPLVYAKKADGRLAFREVLMWVCSGIWAQHSKGRIDSKVATLFTYKLWDVRENLEGLYAMPSGPVPFAYFHLLYFILSLYLLFLSYAFVFVTPLWSIPGYFLILVSLVGLRELGNAMSNPLGDDQTDIPVFHNIQAFFDQSKMLIDINLSYDEPEALRPAE